MSTDGRYGYVGEEWWKTKGRQYVELAHKRGADDAVRGALKLAVPHFDWTTDPLPNGAQKVYDEVKKLTEESDQVPAEQPKPRRARAKSAPKPEATKKTTRRKPRGAAAKKKAADAAAEKKVASEGERPKEPDEKPVEASEETSSAPAETSSEDKSGSTDTGAPESQ